MSRSQEISVKTAGKKISEGNKSNVNEQLRNQRNLEKNECTKCEYLNPEVTEDSSKENTNVDTRNNENRQESENSDVISQNVSTIVEENEDSSDRDKSSSDKSLQAANYETHVQEAFKRSDDESDNNCQES